MELKVSLPPDEEFNFLHPKTYFFFWLNEDFLYWNILIKLLFGIKRLMIKNAWVIRKVYFVKIIHVELTNKRGKFIMPIESRKNTLFKFLLIVNFYSPFLVIPWNHLCMFFRLNQNYLTLSILVSLRINVAGLSSAFFINNYQSFYNFSVF